MYGLGADGQAVTLRPSVSMATAVVFPMAANCEGNVQDKIIVNSVYISTSYVLGEENEISEK